MDLDQKEGECSIGMSQTPEQAVVDAQTTEQPKENPCKSFWKGTFFQLSTFVLFIVTMMFFGLSVSYDAPNVLSPYLIQIHGFDREKIGLLASAYQIPATIMVFLAGVMADELGIMFTSLLVTTLILLGMIVYAAGVSYFPASFAVMFAGRLIIGLGGEPIFTCQSYILTMWFRKESLGLPFGISYLVGLTGTVMCFFFFPMIADAKLVDTPYGPMPDIAFPSWIFLIVQVITLFLVIILAGITYFQRQSGKWAPFKRGNVLKRTVHLFKGFPQLGVSFWFLILTGVTAYAIIYSWGGFTVDCFVTKFGMKELDAAYTAAIFSLVAIPLAPFAGWLVDFTGHRQAYGIMIHVLAMLGMIFVGFTDWPAAPYIAEVTWGILLAFVPAIVQPSINLLVPIEYLGLGYGLSGGLQNLVQIFLSWGTGAWIDAGNPVTNPTTAFNMPTLTFIILCALGIVFSIILYFTDARNNYSLRKTTSRNQGYYPGSAKGDHKPTEEEIAAQLAREAAEREAAEAEKARLAKEKEMSDIPAEQTVASQEALYIYGHYPPRPATQ